MKMSDFYYFTDTLPKMHVGRIVTVGAEESAVFFVRWAISPRKRDEESTLTRTFAGSKSSTFPKIATVWIMTSCVIYAPRRSQLTEPKIAFNLVPKKLFPLKLIFSPEKIELYSESEAPSVSGFSFSVKLFFEDLWITER